MLKIASIVHGNISKTVSTYLWRRPEISLSDLHDVIDPGEQLRINRESTVEFVARLRHKSLRELALEHQHGASEERTVEQELEHLGIG